MANAAWIRSAVAAAALLALSGCGLFGGETQGTAAELQPGDCMTDDGAADQPAITVLECSDPHGYEVFAITELPEGPYPGAREADIAAQQYCSQEFAGFVGLPYDQSSLLLQYFYPLEDTWADGDNGRKVSCLVGGPAEEPITGTLQNSNR